MFRDTSNKSLSALADQSGWRPLLRFGGQKRTDDKHQHQREQHQLRQHQRPGKSKRRYSTPLRTTHQYPSEQQQAESEELYAPRRRSETALRASNNSIPSQILEPKPRFRSSQSDDEGSVVSEVTIMTYTKEKTDMLEEEFFRRASKQSRRLSVQECNVLLQDIQQEIHGKFRRKYEQDKYQMQMHSMSDEDGNDLLHRMHALKSQGDDIARKMREVKSHEKADETQTELLSSSGGAIAQESIQMMQPQPERRRVSWKLPCTAEDEANSDQSIRRTDDEVTTEELDDVDLNHCQVSKQDEARQNSSSPQGNGESRCIRPHEVANNEQHHPDEGEMASIEQIIELKLQVANQQATIDTLASKLHNLELANARLMNQLSESEEKNKHLSSCSRIAMGQQNENSNSKVAMYRPSISISEPPIISMMHYPIVRGGSSWRVVKSKRGSISTKSTAEVSSDSLNLM